MKHLNEEKLEKLSVLMSQANDNTFTEKMFSYIDTTIMQVYSSYTEYGWPRVRVEYKVLASVNISFAASLTRLNTI